MTFPIVLTLVTRDPHNQTAGWNESARSPYPNYFGCFDGPTYYQGESRTRALCCAADSETVRHPSDWPARQLGAAQLSLQPGRCR